MSIGWAVQTAIYGVLSDALECPVYDSVPDDAAYPYVTIDDENMTTADNLNSRIDDRFLNLSVWSDYPGKKEVKEIIDSIYEAIHRKRLPLEEGDAFSVTVDRMRTTRDADERTYMGNVTLRVRTHREPVSLPTYIIQNGKLY